MWPVAGGWWPNRMAKEKNWAKVINCVKSFESSFCHWGLPQCGTLLMLFLLLLFLCIVVLLSVLHLSSCIYSNPYKPNAYKDAQIFSCLVELFSHLTFGGSFSSSSSLSLADFHVLSVDIVFMLLSHYRFHNFVASCQLPVAILLRSLFGRCALLLDSVFCITQLLSF